MITGGHAHYYPPRYLELTGRTGLPPVMAAPPGGQSIGERPALLERAGIDTQVLPVSPAQPYLPDPAAAAEAARVGSDLSAGPCAEHPGRFLALAALPLPHPASRLPRSPGSPASRRPPVPPSAAARRVTSSTTRCSTRCSPNSTGAGRWRSCTRRATRRRHRGGAAAGPGRRARAAPRPPAHHPAPGRHHPAPAARVTRKSAREIPEGLRGTYYDTVSGSPEALPSARRISGAGQDPARHRLPLLR